MAGNKNQIYVSNRKCVPDVNFKYIIAKPGTRTGNHAKVKYLHQLKVSSHRQKCLWKAI